MTVGVIAEEHDEYGEHVARIVHALARSSHRRMRELRDWLGTQSALCLADLEQVMTEKAIEDRHTIHAEECRWPLIPPGKLACCGRMVKSLLNAAADAMRRETGSRRKNLKDRGAPIAVDPDTLSGDLPEDARGATYYDLLGVYSRIAREAEAINAASERARQAVRSLTGGQFDAAIAFGVMELKGDAASEWLGVPVRTANDRWNKARERMRAALTEPEDD